MQMKQCPNGHFYDQSKSEQCPYCTSESANINATRPIFGDGAADIGATVPADQAAFIDRTRPISSAAASTSSADDGRTQPIIKKEIGIDPVVGWIVCIDGKEKGREHRMHADNNFIGRSEKMDICIRGDDTISRDNHAVITYDAQDRLYYFSPGDGRSIVRINGKAIFATVQLAAYDKIDIGQTKFIFMPLCGEAFSWTQS